MKKMFILVLIFFVYSIHAKNGELQTLTKPTKHKLALLNSTDSAIKIEYQDAHGSHYIILQPTETVTLGPIQDLKKINLKGTVVSQQINPASLLGKKNQDKQRDILIKIKKNGFSPQWTLSSIEMDLGLDKVALQLNQFTDEYLDQTKKMIEMIQIKKLGLDAQRTINELLAKIKMSIRLLEKGLTSTADLPYLNLAHARIIDITKDLDLLREKLFIMAKRGEKNLYQALENTYKENFSNTPKIPYKKVYEFLGLTADQGGRLSYKEIMEMVERRSISNDQDRQEVRQLKMIFHHPFLKEEYDAFLQGPDAVAKLQISEKASEALIRQIQNIESLIRPLSTLEQDMNGKTKKQSS